MISYSTRFVCMVSFPNSFLVGNISNLFYFLMVFQMFPWESLPVLRNQDVYRMPSVAGIIYTYGRYCLNQGEDGNDHAVCAMVDPLKSYYLLNPDRNLAKTEACFLEFFTAYNIKVSAGIFFRPVVNMIRNIT